jgi:hypothetical protein
VEKSIENTVEAIEDKIEETVEDIERKVDEVVSLPGKKLDEVSYFWNALYVGGKMYSNYVHDDFADVLPISYLNIVV